MDIPKTYPMVHYILSRVPYMSSPRSEHDIEQPTQQPGSEASTSTDDPQFIDPMVEKLPHLKHPRVVAEMATAVSEIAQTRSVLRALGDRPYHETVDKAKEKLVEIDSNLASQLEEMVLAPRPTSINQNDWRAHLADKEMELREAAEKEKAAYKAIIQLDEMHAEYEKLLRDAELRLTKIYDSAAARIEAAEGGECEGTDDENSNSNWNARELLNDEVAEILRVDAAREGITRVNLAGRKLKIVPEAFGRIEGLRALNLSNNQLQYVPDSIAAGLKNLEELILSSNLLESLPDSIGLLLNLKILNVSGNKLSALPDSICHCRSLVELDASFNNLTYLPTYLGNEMANLRRLSVQYNKLNSLPTSVCEMKSLQHLDVHFNELRGLPFSIGNLTNLESLNLSGNFSDLKELPPTFGELINLKELDLSNNQIHALPDTFGRLDSLEKLNLDHNPIMVPPVEVVNQGVEAVKAYMAQRWLDLLVQEEERSMQRLKEETQSSWLRRSLSRLKQQVSSVSGYLGTTLGGERSRDPCLDQQL